MASSNERCELKAIGRLLPQLSSIQTPRNILISTLALHGWCRCHRIFQQQQWLDAIYYQPFASYDGKDFQLRRAGRVLTQAHMKAKFKPARIFKNAIEPLPPPSPGTRATPPEPRQITGIAFDDRGDQVLTASEDETFRLYSCKTGKQVPLGHPICAH